MKTPPIPIARKPPSQVKRTPITADDYLSIIAAQRDMLEVSMRGFELRVSLLALPRDRMGRVMDELGVSEAKVSALQAEFTRYFQAICSRLNLDPTAEYRAVKDEKGYALVPNDSGDAPPNGK